MMMEIERRYGALRVISGLLRVLAWAALILSIIAAVGLFLTGNRASLSPEGLPPALNTAFGAGLISLGVGIVYFILFYAFADSIIVFVDIEENTRTAARALPPGPLGRATDARVRSTTGAAATRTTGRPGTRGGVPGG